MSDAHAGTISAVVTVHGQRSAETAVAIAVAGKPYVGHQCLKISADALSTCDNDHDDFWFDLCVYGAACDPTKENQCGTSHYSCKALP